MQAMTYIIHKKTRPEDPHRPWTLQGWCDGRMVIKRHYRTKREAEAAKDARKAAYESGGPDPFAGQYGNHESEAL